MADPVEFPGFNVVIGKNQPEYLPLPARIEVDGSVVSCWRLSPDELAEVQRTGCVYVGQLTFNRGLQPQFVAGFLPGEREGSADHKTAEGDGGQTHDPET